jgi:hypothetical protein
MLIGKQREEFDASAGPKEERRAADANAPLRQCPIAQSVLSFGVLPSIWHIRNLVECSGDMAYDADGRIDSPRNHNGR